MNNTQYLNSTKHLNTKTLVSIGIFAAVVFLGIQSFRIPMPAAVGTPFLHFGHIFVCLAIFCLGAKYSAVASTLGFIVFDIINGYMHAIPNVLVTTIINCLITGVIFAALVKKAAANKSREHVIGIICAVIYGIVNIFTDFVWSVGELVVLGSSLTAAVVTISASIPATIINSGFTVVGTALFYRPVKGAWDRLTRS